MKMCLVCWNWVLEIIVIACIVGGCASNEREFQNEGIK